MGEERRCREVKVLSVMLEKRRNTCPIRVSKPNMDLDDLERESKSADIVGWEIEPLGWLRRLRKGEKRTLRAVIADLKFRGMEEGRKGRIDSLQ